MILSFSDTMTNRSYPPAGFLDVHFEKGILSGGQPQRQARFAHPSRRNKSLIVGHPRRNNRPQQTAILRVPHATSSVDRPLDSRS